MFEMTESLIHHARFCVLNMTSGDPVEAARELATAKACAFDAGRAAFRSYLPKPTYFPTILEEAYQHGNWEAALDASEEREVEEWRRTYAEEQEYYRLNYLILQSSASCIARAGTTCSSPSQVTRNAVVAARSCRKTRKIST